MRESGFFQRVKQGFEANIAAILVLAVMLLIGYLRGFNGQLAFTLWLTGSLFLIIVNAPAIEASQSHETVGTNVEVEDDNLIAGVQAGLAILDTPVALLNAHGHVLFQNAAAQHSFGAWPIGEHISTKLRSPALVELVKDVVASTVPQQIEYAEKLPVERDYIVRVAPSASGVHADDIFYILSFREITDIRRIDRMRSDFVANASHELRTPLASLRGFIETLQGPAKDDVGARERFLNIMLDQATRMNRLVDDLMSLSRLELKANIAPDQKVELNGVLRHVHDTLLPLANELGVEMNLHLPEQQVSVIGDRDELVQVFQNLIENACKYGQEGKEVDIWLRSNGTEPVEVSVMDKGQGIASEHIPRLTERFYRASISESRSKKGTGLGLAIVKHILTRHKARLIIRSQIGQGTDFTVRF